MKDESLDTYNIIKMRKRLMAAARLRGRLEGFAVSALFFLILFFFI